MEKSANRTSKKRPLLDRAYWLSRPIEERFAAVQELPRRGRPRAQRDRSGLISVASLLNSTDIEYMVIGGYALAAHGLPRITAELDIWIESSRGNVYFLLQALSTFGFGSLDLTESHLSSAETYSRLDELGQPPVRIDLLTALDGVHFADCYPRRAVMVMSGVSLPIIELEDLRISKRASRRPRDLADLESIDEAVAA